MPPKNKSKAGSFLWKAQCLSSPGCEDDLSLHKDTGAEQKVSQLQSLPVLQRPMPPCQMVSPWADPFSDGSVEGKVREALVVKQFRWLQSQLLQAWSLRWDDCQGFQTMISMILGVKIPRTCLLSVFFFLCILIWLSLVSVEDIHTLEVVQIKNEDEK